MTSAIKLSCDTVRCEIAPTLDSTIAGPWLGKAPVLPPGESMSAKMRLHVERVA